MLRMRGARNLAILSDAGLQEAERRVVWLRGVGRAPGSLGDVVWSRKAM
jgi:hypothetical protein